MPQALLAHEPVIRLGAFASVLIVMALWEALAPRRPQAIGRARRWPGNFGVVVIGTQPPPKSGVYDSESILRSRACGQPLDQLVGFAHHLG